MNNKNLDTDNYFKLKDLYNDFGRQPSTKQSGVMYHHLKRVLNEQGRLLVVEYYPQLLRHARVIGYHNISRKMIEDYKG